MTKNKKDHIEKARKAIQRAVELRDQLTYRKFRGETLTSKEYELLNTLNDFLDSFLPDPYRSLKEQTENLVQQILSLKN